MDPVTVTTSVPTPQQEVFDFLDVLANHEQFVDHLFDKWSFSGPKRGVGAKAKARANTPMSQDWTDFEVVEAQAPERIVEQAVGNKGKRETSGTYTLEGLADGRTKISFEFAWQQPMRLERFFGPLTRAAVRRANGKSLRRLAKLLEQRGSASG